MKPKVNKDKFPQFDKFDRKQKKHTSSKSKSSKRRLSIYDEFDDDDLMGDFSSPYDYDE